MTPRLIERTRMVELLARERAALESATPRSRSQFATARARLAGGVVSSFQSRSPYPIYLVDGRGAAVWDIDGREHVDLHMGFGAMIVGHAHPRIAQVLRDRADRATHLGAPMPDAVPVAAELQRRFGLESWRFCNSGTEATMAGIRLARAATGRQKIVKIVASYNGHHDPVLVPPARGASDSGELVRLGLAASPVTLQVGFNDVAALEAAFDSHPDAIACLVVELPMLAPYPCLPEAGYLEAIRVLTRERGALLVLDEVKTGVTIASGGATEHYGLDPDIVALAKAIGGGLPTGAVGARPELMELIARGEPPIYGTFNGNPLAMAACSVTLGELLGPAAYRELHRLGDRLADGARAAIAATGLPLGVVSLGPKGGLRATPDSPADYWDWERRRDLELTELLWLYQLNRGVYLSPVPRLHWTLSIAHSDADVDRFVANLLAAGGELAG